MKIECLQQKKEIDKKEILANFLRTIVAVAKYGRTTIYEGDIYYVPYTIVSYQVEETKEVYQFITSEVSEDVAVFKQDEKRSIEMVETEADKHYVVDGMRDNDELLEEVEKKIMLNKKMRKMFQKYHFELQEMKTIYLPEQTFYGRGKKDYLFLVDPLLQKVDFKNLSAVEERFAKNYMQSAEQKSSCA